MRSRTSGSDVGADGNEAEKDQFLSWNKAYQLAMSKPGTVLLATARLDERERLFKWVGPISTPRFSLFADRKRAIRLSSMDGALKYRIGTVTNDAAEMLLLNRGFTKEQLDRSGDIKGALGRLQEGKCDMLAYSEMSLRQSVRSYGLAEDHFENVIPIAGSSVFFAFHKDTADSVIKSFQEALNSLKNDGSYKRIKEKYGFFD